MDIFILELVSNQSNVPVKIDGMQQHEETRSLLRIGDQLRASAGFLVPCFHVTLAKLSGVVPNEYSHPRTSIQSVKRTCKN